MSTEAGKQANSTYEPVLVGPKPFSLDAILASVNPAPDEKTERLVEMIYADRRQSADGLASE